MASFPDTSNARKNKACSRQRQAAGPVLFSVADAFTV
jgi:hypothetical protein